MLVKEARQITGGLSNPSKMPTKAYSLPPRKCKVGSILRKREGTVCSECYACKGRFMFTFVQNAMERRLNSLHNKKWVEAMILLIERACKKIPYFRFHDSGDLQGKWHLENILKIVKELPKISFWLPTMEHDMVSEYIDILPMNLNIRLTSHYMDSVYDTPGPSAMVYTKEAPKNVHVCQATLTGGVCGECRACWNKDVSIIGYKKH